MTNDIIKMFVTSFLLTIFIESMVGFLWGMRTKKELLLLFLVNLLTNPAAVFLTWMARYLFSLESTMYLQYMIEIAVVLVEGILYKIFLQKGHWKVRRPILFAATANGTSWFVGVILQWFF